MLGYILIFYLVDFIFSFFFNFYFKLQKGSRFTNISCFISNSISKLSFYKEVNEFSEIEEFNPSFIDIFNNIKAIDFSLEQSELSSKFFATVASKNCGSYFSHDIAFPPQVFLVSRDLFLFQLFSSYLKFKLILEASF